MKITETAKRLAVETPFSPHVAQVLIDRFGLGALDAARAWIATGIYPRESAPFFADEQYAASFAGQREIRLRKFDDAIDATWALGGFGLVARFVLRRARAATAKALRFPHPEPVFRDGEFVGIRPGPRS